MSEFRFAIGDLVYTRAGVEDATLVVRSGAYHFPRSLMVTERHTQECPGGVQLHYTCSADGHSLRALEVELMPRSELDVGAFLDALIKAADRRRAKPPAAPEAE